MTVAATPVTLITGAASGLGQALAFELARRGARILATDLPTADLGPTCEGVRAAGGQATPHPLDVRDPAQFAAAWAAAEAAYGPVDLLINNAGVAVVGPMADVSLDDWRFQLDVNLWGVIHGCRLAAQRMPARGHGALLNVASAAGLLSPPKMAPYNVSKAAVIALTETLAAELRGTGVTCTVLAPLFFQTNLMATSRVTDPRIKKTAAREMAKGKLTAADVARDALEALDAGRLYALPMPSGRWYWRAKRLMPQGYVGLLHRITQRALKR